MCQPSKATALQNHTLQQPRVIGIAYVSTALVCGNLKKPPPSNAMHNTSSASTSEKYRNEEGRPELNCYLMEKKEETNNNKEERNNEGKAEDRIPQMALNHVSRLCRDVKESIDFYSKVLGLVLIERPPAFEFDGAWLFNYGVGVHLIQAKDEDSLPKTDRGLDPMDNHISFQCEDMEALEQRLKQFNVKYTKRTIDDDKNGTKIDQLFFCDPDGYMIEMCNCENLKLVPAGSLGNIKLPCDRHNPPVDLENGRPEK